MLKICTCDCGSAEPLVRRLLQECGLHDWMTVEVHKGRRHCLVVLEYLMKELGDSLPLRALIDYIDNAGSFAVVIGYDDTHLYWSDIHSGAPLEWTQASAIVKKFA